MTTRAATGAGIGAIGLWALLALLTARSGAEVPPFQMLALTFAVATALGALRWVGRPDRARALRQKPAVWAVGVGGLFGFHALYFAAMRLAPPAEVSLIGYLWPLLIVLLSAALPGERLRPAQLGGALVGFAGVLVLVAGRDGGIAPRPEYLPGYGLAFACAWVWAGYSVLSRRFGTVPTDAVTGFCGATAALALGCHLAVERWIWPDGTGAWLAIAGAGLGPVGAAFYLWDVGCKHGDLRLLGTLSYAIPVLSTLVLVAAGYAEPSASLGVACALIASGAALAASAAGRR